MSSWREIVDRSFGRRGGELLIGEIGVTDLAASFGTPFFVYRAEVIDACLRRLKEALPDGFEVHYSMKANPAPAVIRHLLARGCGLEVASGGELMAALSAGCEPSRILYAGPGKSVAELRLALECGVGEIHVESSDELDRLAAEARPRGQPAPICVRVNPGARAQGGALQMGGSASPFGIDEERLDPILDRILGDPALELRGLHVYCGSQILDSDVLIEQYRHALALGRRIAGRIGRPLRSLDFGGGFGIPYFDGQRDLDLERFGSGIRGPVGEARRDAALRETRFLVEPGRYLVGEAGIYVTGVNTVKTSRGRTFLVVDGGMNHHLAASGNLGQVIRRNFPVALVNGLDRPVTETVDIVGPLCTPLDVLARGVPFPVAAAGDLVGIFLSGAYVLSASPTGFLSHPAPPEVWVEGGTHRLTRRRGTFGNPRGEDVEEPVRSRPRPT